jgi:hypothetical protein
MDSVRVPGFLPSENGLHFSNCYPHEPQVVVDFLGHRLEFGDAANGLCGGMVYAVCDYFVAQQPIPDLVEPPPSGSPLFKFIVRRLLQSFNLPLGLNRYMELMTPLLPDVGTFGLPGRAGIMIDTEWPAIRRELDAGRLVPLGLIKVKSARPRDLTLQHQILAYGYDLDGDQVALCIYDPNYPNNDGVRLSLNVADARRPVALTYSPGEAVFCFFRTHYEPKQPPRPVPQAGGPP